MIGKLYKHSLKNGMKIANRTINNIKMNTLSIDCKSFLLQQKKAVAKPGMGVRGAHPPPLNFSNTYTHTCQLLMKKIRNPKLNTVTARERSDQARGSEATEGG